VILGVSHLTLGTIDLQQSISQWQALGYTTRFEDLGVANDASKKPLLFRYCPTHDLCTMHRDEGGIPIEAIKHGPEFAPGSGRFKLDAGQLSLLTTDMAQTQEFWTNALRFSAAGSDRLTLRSPVPNWGCEMLLREMQDLPPSYLDSSGGTCLALLSRDIESDTAKAAEYGAADIAGPFSLLVDGKQLRVSIFRSPTGEFCEFVQIEGKK